MPKPWNKNLVNEDSWLDIVSRQIKEQILNKAKIGAEFSPVNPKQGAIIGGLIGGIQQAYQTGQNLLTAGTSQLVKQEPFKRALTQQKPPHELLPVGLRDIPISPTTGSLTPAEIMDIGYDPFLIPIGEIAGKASIKVGELFGKIAELTKVGAKTQDAIRIGKTLQKADIPVIQKEIGRLSEQSRELARGATTPQQLTESYKKGYQAQLLNEAIQAKQGRKFDILSEQTSVPEQKLIDALKEAKPARAKQEAIYTIVGLTLCLISLAFGSYVFLVIYF